MLTWARTNDVMKTYVALFRGINMGGHNTLRMKELVALLEEIGLQDVRTYLQSGNALFRSVIEDAAKLGTTIGLETEKRFGFAPHVLVLDVQELTRVVASNPFPEAESEPTSLHVLFLASAPAIPDLRALDSLKSPTERFRLEGRVFFLHAPDSVGRSRLAAQVERKLGVPTTGRNWRTVNAVLASLRELDRDFSPSRKAEPTG